MTSSITASVTVLIKSGETSTAYISARKHLNLANRHAPRIERKHLVVETGEPALVLGDQPRLERALAITRDLNRQRPVVGQDRLAACPVAVIGGGIRSGAAGRVAQMVRELAAQGPLDNRFLEAPDRRVQLLVGNRALADELSRISDGTGAKGAPG